MTAVKEPLRFFTCDGEDLSPPLPLLSIAGDDVVAAVAVLEVVVVVIEIVFVVVVLVAVKRFCDGDVDDDERDGDMLCDGDALGELAADLSADMLGFPPELALGCLGEEIVCLGLTW